MEEKAVKSSTKKKPSPSKVDTTNPKKRKHEEVEEPALRSSTTVVESPPTMEVDEPPRKATGPVISEETRAFIQHVCSGKPLEVDSIKGSGLNPILDYLDRKRVTYRYRILNSNVTLNLTHFCDIFIQAFIATSGGVLVGHKEGDLFVKSLDGFHHLTSLWKQNKIQYLIYTVDKNLESTHHLIAELKAKILNRMVNETSGKELDWRVFKFMQQCQSWAWWSSLYPTELVYIVGRLMFGASHEQDSIVNTGLFLKDIFDPGLIVFPRDPASQQRVYIPMFLMIHRTRHTPDFGRLFVDIKTIANLDPAKSLAAVAELVEGSTTHVLQFGITQTKFELASANVLNMTRILSSLLPAGYEENEYNVISLTTSVPLSMCVLLTYHSLLDQFSVWHNLLRQYTILDTGRKSIVDWNTLVNQTSKSWYRNLTAHQMVYNQFMALNSTSMGAVVDRSFKIGLEMASHLTVEKDWLYRFLEVVFNQYEQAAWKWPLLPESVETGDQIRTFLLTLFDTSMMGKMWVQSCKSLMLTQSSAKGVFTENWRLVLCKTVRGLPEMRVVLEGGHAPKTTTTYVNGYQPRPVSVSTAQFRSSPEFTSEQVITNSSELLEKHFNVFDYAKVKIMTHLNSGKNFPVEEGSKHWLNVLVGRVFGDRVEAGLKNNSAALVKLLHYVYLNYRNTSESFTAEFSHMAINPEFVPTSMIQILLHLIHENFCTLHGNKDLAWHSTQAPFVPCNSIALDTWMIASLSDFSTEISQRTDNGRECLLLVLQNNAWIILEIKSLYRITFTVEVIYHSPSLASDKKLATGAVLNFTDLSKYLSQTQFLIRTTEMGW